VRRADAQLIVLKNAEMAGDGRSIVIEEPQQCRSALLTCGIRHTQRQDARMRFAGAVHQRAEVTVLGDDQATFANGPRQDGGITQVGSTSPAKTPVPQSGRLRYSGIAQVGIGYAAPRYPNGEHLRNSKRFVHVGRRRREERVHRLLDRKCGLPPTAAREVGWIVRAEHQPGEACSVSSKSAALARVATGLAEWAGFGGGAAGV